MMLGRLSDTVVSALDSTQSQLGTATARLSSGLRINTAADDPSGLAISTSLQTQAQGLDQGQIAVQTASNALTVADGALEQTQDILQRMRALVVSGRSDLLSDADRADLNQELTQLTDEINTIAEKTNFNGLNLLDGTLSSALPTYPQLIIPENDALSSGQTLLDPTQFGIIAGNSPQNLSVTIDSYDPNTGLLTVTNNTSSPDPAQTYNSTYPDTYQVLVGTNYDNLFNELGVPPPPGVNNQSTNDGNGNPILSFGLNDLSADDVGATAFVYSVNGFTPPSTGHAAQVAIGDNEGDTVSIDIDAVSAEALGVNGVQLTSNDLTNEGDEYRIDRAIDIVSAQRAKVGTQTVALQETASDAATADNALTASYSAIRDVDVAAETTQYTKLQILHQVQISVLGTVHTDVQGIYTLLSASFAG
jgi:flagellin